ncbi:hypothetical protein ACFWBX_03575 [Streptomyces sp. NPDC059991]|uniref:hypothetical protein n=1 Tax=Streptomyces sp. NPDC059991 TaxID=3347028 RepID=UPI003689A0D8
MTNRWRRTVGRLAVGGALMAAAVMTGQSAHAAEMPGMLEPSDMPPDPFSEWQYAGSGMNDLWYCQRPGSPLPEENSWGNDYSTPETAAGYQRVYVLPSEAEAVALTGQLDAAFTGCEAYLEERRPDVDVTYNDYGLVDVEEGAHVYGFGWDGSWSRQNYLASVGRDGNTVTVVGWESNWGTAPVDAFKETTRTAVAKLY